MQQGHAREDTVDVLFMLTSFQTFDMLAGATRTPADVVPLVVRAARALLGRVGG
jgi:Na+-translocating ferredoxin:NAD+ oxidoreductase RnfG subunit